MTKDKLLSLVERHGDIRWSGECHDCGEDLDVDGKSNGGSGVEITGGAVYEVVNNADYRIYLKCDGCYERDRDLKNYQECEVYSRVVGYLRPVSQWNNGKQSEWAERKTFDKNMGGN